MKRLTVGLAAAAGACLCGGVVLSQAAAEGGGSAHASQTGGVSITPQIFETRARRGSGGSVTVKNTTNGALRVTVRPRPWLQGRDGLVAADTRRTLSRQVRLTPSTFTLAKGAGQNVRLTLLKTSGGSLYGGFEAVGVPQNNPVRNGIRVRYRLVSSLRFNPETRRLGVRVGSARETGRGRTRAILLSVRNTGNTVEPISGSVVLTGSGVTRPNTLKPVRILPRRTIPLTLGTMNGLLRGLRPGRYTLKVTLKQANRNTNVTRRVSFR